MTTTTISEFRANAKKYIDNVISDNGTLIINRGNTAAVLISLEEYNSIKTTERVLASQVVTDNLTNGIEQCKNGQSIEVDIDSL
jgi:antitoxin YefM